LNWGGGEGKKKTPTRAWKKNSDEGVFGVKKEKRRPTTMTTLDRGRGRIAPVKQGKKKGTDCALEGYREGGEDP